MTASFDSPPALIQFIQEIFQRRGAEAYLGESVTMSEHMLQCALLAEQAHADDAIVAAALLHDIGHFSGDFPDDALEQGIDNLHETTGSALLNDWFPEVTVDCVRHHVDAKRYLCAVDGDYFDTLSAASVHTLNLQGGPMSDDEVNAFRELPHLEQVLQVRRWDEQSKVPGKETPDFEHYLPILQRACAAAKETGK